MTRSWRYWRRRAWWWSGTSSLRRATTTWSCPGSGSSTWAAWRPAMSPSSRRCVGWAASSLSVIRPQSSGSIHPTQSFVKSPGSLFFLTACVLICFKNRSWSLYPHFFLLPIPSEVSVFLIPISHWFMYRVAGFDNRLQLFKISLLVT